jgi:hypothetical protein
VSDTEWPEWRDNPYPGDGEPSAAPEDCARCGGKLAYSGEHRLGGQTFRCGRCGTGYTF